MHVFALHRNWPNCCACVFVTTLIDLTLLESLHNPKSCLHDFRASEDVEMEAICQLFEEQCCAIFGPG
ncbi:hypothetical protein M758_6G009600 [Ceratodon purpureus]|uniref:Uncharacterized protein n=1 Tax=Ceratodon purpureus TaxID=3225 RepID=A0A8T0HDC8_CERPU|nr:hypothetical protein KC19_6G011400 [Ceratodon purpureus]KAG0612198.1 hypothetical protein M758_6G009600 [Ceratodon purpureus]